MKKRYILLVSILVLSGSVTAGNAITVVCTTTALETLAKAVGGERVDVISLVQPGVCPSHFDVRPSHIAEVGQASLIMYHGTEPWLEDLITASANQTAERLLLKGPWNTPPLAAQKLEEIRDALVRVDPENSTYYEENAAQAIDEISNVAEAIKADAETLSVDTVPALCMEWQQSFVEWVGFPVVGSYPPPETLSVKDVSDLINTGRTEGAILVIDNLQSGTELGSEIAAEIGGYHVILSNFPNAVPETENIPEMLEYNARQLFDTVKKYNEEKGKISELESQLKEEIRKKKVFEAISVMLLVLCCVEAALLYVRRQ